MVETSLRIRSQRSGIVCKACAIQTWETMDARAGMCAAPLGDVSRDIGTNASEDVMERTEQTVHTAHLLRCFLQRYTRLSKDVT